MIWNKFLNVHGAYWTVLTDGGKYTKLVRANDPTKTFEYFLNPAAFGGVSTEIVHNGSGFVPSGASELDDRYTVGRNLRLVFGGSNSYPVFDVNVNLDNYTLVTAYAEARLVPALLVSFVDKRLASSDLYLMVFPTFWNEVSNLNFNTPADKDAFFLSLLNPQELLRYFVANFSVYSSALFFDTSSSSVRLQLNSVVAEKLFTHDGTPITNEELLFSHTSTLNQGTTLLSSLVAAFRRITGSEEKYSLYPYHDQLGKALSGAYTIVQRPERLIHFNKIVSDALTSLATSFITDPLVQQQFVQLGNQVLSEGFKDWFRPSQYRVIVGYQNNQPIYDYVNVFLAFQGGNYSDGVVLVDANGRQIGVPVSFGDTFSYFDMEHNRAYPAGKQYVTGPHGHIPVYDSNGNIIDWVPDSYAR